MHNCEITRTALLGADSLRLARASHAVVTLVIVSDPYRRAAVVAPHVVPRLAPHGAADHDNFDVFIPVEAGPRAPKDRAVSWNGTMVRVFTLASVLGIAVV